MKQKFKYRLSKGCKAYHCGPAYYGKINGVSYDTVSIWRKIFYYLFIAGIWSGIALSVLLVYLALTLPNIENIMNQTRSPSITILDRSGENQ